MNTQAHVLLNHIVLRKKDRPDLSVPIFVGAILPDFVMFVFFFYEKILRGQPEEKIWGELYYDPFWQAWIDVFNSIPIFALICLFAWRLGKTKTLVLGLSALLHIVLDFPLHHDDAHRHFYPFSDFRFESPVSYWDPNHFGHIASSIEMTLYLVGGIYIWKHLRSRLAKLGLVLGGAAYLAAAVYWGGLSS